MYLWLKLYTVPFFVSGQTYKISKGSNNYCSHCNYFTNFIDYCSSLALFCLWAWTNDLSLRCKRLWTLPACKELMCFGFRVWIRSSCRPHHLPLSSVQYGGSRGPDFIETLCFVHSVFSSSWCRWTQTPCGWTWTNCTALRPTSPHTQICAPFLWLGWASPGPSTPTTSSDSWGKSAERATSRPSREGDQGTRVGPPCVGHSQQEPLRWGRNRTEPLMKRRCHPARPEARNKKRTCSPVKETQISTLKALL